MARRRPAASLSTASDDDSRRLVVGRRCLASRELKPDRDLLPAPAGSTSGALRSPAATPTRRSEALEMAVSHRRLAARLTQRAPDPARPGVAFVERRRPESATRTRSNRCCGAMPGVADVRVLAAPDAATRPADRRLHRSRWWTAAHHAEPCASSAQRAWRRFKIPRTIIFLDAIPTTAPRQDRSSRPRAISCARASRCSPRPCDIFTSLAPVTCPALPARS